MNEKRKRRTEAASNASITESRNLESLRLALEEMRLLYERRSKSAASLDQKAGTILGAASLVLSLVTTLQLTLLGADQPWFYWVGLGAVFILYIVMISLTIWAMEPTVYPTPIKANWETLDRRLFRVDQKEAILTMIRAYKDRNNTIKSILAKKALKVRRAGRLLAAIALILTTLSLVAARGIGS